MSLKKWLNFILPSDILQNDLLTQNIRNVLKVIYIDTMWDDNVNFSRKRFWKDLNNRTLRPYNEDFARSRYYLEIKRKLKFWTFEDQNFLFLNKGAPITEKLKEFVSQQFFQQLLIPYNIIHRQIIHTTWYTHRFD